MFDNVLYQSASDLLIRDIANNKLPGSILFSGPAASGKLTCALELARVLSCTGEKKGSWACLCPSCRKHKALVSPNVLLLGPGNRSLEIAAAKNTLLAQAANDTNHVAASRYLFLRAVRKLTNRFSPLLWEGEDKQSKFSPILQTIDENLELLNPDRDLPEGDELAKILDEVQKQCDKLESTYLYDAIPVSQVRNFSSWARLSSASGKKVLIIENADEMADSARNALLKILEEPPENVIFILTTTRRLSMLPTILSRVRTYSFFERTKEQQQEVISRVFHYDPTLTRREIPPTIDAFMRTYLPVDPSVVKSASVSFFTSIASGHMCDVAPIVSSCSLFKPRLLFRIFIEGIIDCQRSLASTPAGAEASSQVLEVLQKTYNNVNVYNQNPQAALEQLGRNLLQVNHIHGGILASCLKEKDA